MAFFGGGGGAAASDMVGATSSVAGTAGLVPAPAAGNQGKALLGDGTFSFATFPSGGSYGTKYVGWPTMTHAANISLVARSTSADYLIRGGMFYPKGTYDRIGIYVSTAASGGNKNVKIGIYDSTSAGEVGSLVANGTASIDNTGACEASVSSFTLDSKFYYTAYILQASATIWMFNSTVAPCIPWSTFTGVSQNYGFGSNNFSVGGYGAVNYSTGLPSDLTTISVSSDVNTWVFVRKS
jgi:hypothetical protein